MICCALCRGAIHVCERECVCVCIKERETEQRNWVNGAMFKEKKTVDDKSKHGW